MSDDAINPYKELGVDFDPFGVAVRFNLPFPLAEAFKKFACAGIDGRVKSREQDIKEAVYSVKRTIEYHERGLIQHSKRDIAKIRAVFHKYESVFGIGYVTTNAFKCAMLILHYITTGDVIYLQKIIEEYENGK